MLPYLLTSDDTLIIQLASGPKFVYLYSFNYWKIRKNIDQLTEDQLTELLKTPPLPNGIFRLFMQDKDMYVANIRDNNTVNSKLKNGRFVIVNDIVTNMPYNKLMGVFASMDDIKDAFPEYFI